MDVINLLGGAMGLSFVSGINLYATILAVGLGINTGLIQPAEGMESLQTLANPLVLLAAGGMYAAEFFADKVPWVDSSWDTIHTFIRPVGGALIAASAIGDVSAPAELAVMLLGGSVALSTHATKASTRMVINQSPEPITNIIVSTFEDVVAFVGAWMALQHPAVMLLIVVAALAVMAFFGPKIARLMRLELAIIGTLLRNIVGGKSPAWDVVPEKYRDAVPPGFTPSQADFCLQAVSGKGTPLNRNLMGVLCMQDDRLVFLTRSWFRPKHHEVSLTKVSEAWMETKLLMHRIGMQTDTGLVRFSCFRDRSGRVSKALDLIQARVGTPAPTAADMPSLEDRGAPA